MTLVEPVQVRPTNGEILAVVQTAAAGMDVPRIRHPKTVLMESPIANGCTIKTKRFI